MMNPKKGLNITPKRNGCFCEENPTQKKYWGIKETRREAKKEIEFLDSLLEGECQEYHFGVLRSWRLFFLGLSLRRRKYRHTGGG